MTPQQQWGNQLLNTTYSQGQSGVLGGQAGLAQMQAKQAAYMQALAGTAAQSMPKADPKNEFLEKVRKIYMKKMEIKIRLAMGIGGLVAFIFAPWIGYQVFRLWSWVGVGSPVRESAAGLVGLVLVLASIAFVFMSFDGSVANDWARRMVMEKEVK